MKNRNIFLIIFTILTLFVIGAFYYKAENPTIEDCIVVKEYPTHIITLEKVEAKTDTALYFNVTVENKTSETISFDCTGFCIANGPEVYQSFSAFLNSKQTFLSEFGEIPAGKSDDIAFIVSINSLDLKKEWELSLDLRK